MAAGAGKAPAAPAAPGAAGSVLPAAAAAVLDDSAAPTPTCELRELFDSLDTDGNGRLELGDLQEALSVLGLPSGRRYLGDLLAQYDRDASKCIDFEEFKEYVQSKEARIRAVFASIDGDGDGRLDATEVHRAARQLGLGVAAEEADKMVALLDKDGDGHISWLEFRRFVVLLPGAQVSHTHILSAWVDSSSWVESMEYQLNHIPPSQPLERFLAGGVAGAVSRTVVAPLERLRTIMMADPTRSQLGPVLRSMWADGGVKGLFRGNLATVAKVFPSSAVQFACYDGVQEALLHWNGPGCRDLSAPQKLLAGLLAGGASCVATYPLEALRTQVSVAQGGGRDSSYLAVARSLIAERGFRGLYQGFTAGLLNNSVTLALSFATYEGLISSYARWRNAPPNPTEKGALGGTAALVVTAATMPLENVLRRMQVQGRPGFPRKYASTADCAAQLLRNEGAAIFWRGSLSSFAKIVPSIAATRLLYESIVELRGIGGIRRYRTSDSS